METSMNLEKYKAMKKDNKKKDIKNKFGFVGVSFRSHQRKDGLKVLIKLFQKFMGSSGNTPRGILKGKAL